MHTTQNKPSFTCVYSRTVHTITHGMKHAGHIWLIIYDWSKSIVLYTSGWLVNGVAKQEVALGCESTSKEYPKETGKTLNVCVAKKTAWLRLR